MSGSQSSMMSFSQDIASAEAPPPIPARSYRGEVIGAVVRPAQSSGILYLNLQFRIGADQYPADYTEGDPDGTIVYARVRATDDMVGRFQMKRAMARLGGPTGSNIDCNALIGLWANIDVTHSPDQEGDMRAQVSRLLDP
jgi:hypothetical protein